MELSTTKNFTHKAKDYVSFYNEDGEPRLNVEGIVEVTAGSSSSGGSLPVTDDNNDWTHYTDPSHLVDESNQAVANYYYSPEIDGASFSNGSIQLKGDTDGSGVVFKIYMTNNPDAATPTAASAPSSDWDDVSTEVFGAASITLDGASKMIFINNKVYKKAIISYDIDNATNSTDVWIIKTA